VHGDVLMPAVRNCIRTWARHLCAGFMLIASACATSDINQSNRESAAIGRSLRAVALSAEQRGDYATALVYYRRLHRNDPDDVDSTLGYVRSLRASGSPNRAVEILENELSEGPENGAVLAELGRSQLAIGNVDGAIQTLNDAITAGSGQWQTFLALGVSYDRHGNHTAAQQSYEAALLLSKSNLSVLNNLALSHALQGSISKGIEILERAASMPGATIRIRQNLALLHGVNGDAESAEKVASVDLDKKSLQENLVYYIALRTGDPNLDGSLKPSHGTEQAAAIPAGTLRVEVGGAPTVENAIDQWESIQTRHQSLLSELSVEIVKHRLADGASQFLTWAGPIADNSQARSICAQLTANNIRCSIVSP
jgi:Flp pilus assembly protein TadD